MAPSLALLLLVAGAASTEWDLAVLTSTTLELLGDEMSLVNSHPLGVKNISALTYDPLYLSHYFAASGHPNASIFRVQASRDGRVAAIEPLIKKQPGKIYSLAYDPQSTSVFWTTYRKILRSQVDIGMTEGEVILEFEKDLPLAITVEPCSRYIYWSYRMTYIDRSRMDGSQRERIVEGLYMPISISISQAERKLYWIDEGPGVSFRIGRSLLDGSNKEVILEGKHQQPNSLAVRPTVDHGVVVFWTDKMSNQLWILKENGTEPESVKSFEDQVYSVAVADSMENLDRHVCSNIITMRDQVPYSAILPTPKACVHGSYSTNSGSCVCTPGYIGTLCETSICFNYCLNGGTCSMTGGKAYCRCPQGRTGSRCEADLCTGYCYRGSCEPDVDGQLLCNCDAGWLGPRCNVSAQYCSYACANDLPDVQGCRCNSTLFAALTAPLDLSKDYKTGFIVSLGACGLLSLAILGLVVKTCQLRRRPRVRRLYKVTPHKGSASPARAKTSPDCEIAIENCCNMNICETPCYEPELRPTSGKNKKEEKRGLLKEMEVQPDCGKTF